jgi:hypothetical protein
MRGLSVLLFTSILSVTPDIRPLPSASGAEPTRMRPLAALAKHRHSPQAGRDSGLARRVSPPSAVPIEDVGPACGANLECWVNLKTPCPRLPAPSGILRCRRGEQITYRLHADGPSQYAIIQFNRSGSLPLVGSIGCSRLRGQPTRASVTTCYLPPTSRTSPGPVVSRTDCCFFATPDGVMSRGPLTMRPWTARVGLRHGRRGGLEVGGR